MKRLIKENTQRICPFCGSTKVYPKKARKLIAFNRVLGWSCANGRCHMYRKLFPSPSYGSGRKDMG